MKLNLRNSEKALTLIEILMIIAVVAVLAALFLPALPRPGPAARSRAICVNNLKQIGQAFHEWAADHGGKYPMELSMPNGGTREFISRGGVYLHFLVLSNELNTPKILYCPKDESHQPATTFAAGFTEANISYFIGVDAAQKNPSMFLAGDLNLTNGSLQPNRILDLKSNSVVGWTEKIHGQRGHVGLADGSVQSFTTSKVREGLADTGVATNRLAMPWY